MLDVGGRPANFWIQSNALLRKNITFQKRRMCANIMLILIPAFFCILFAFLQFMLDRMMNQPNKKCGSDPLNIAHFDESCPIPKPPEWPPLLKLPKNDVRAVKTDSFKDLPEESCRTKGFCPVTVLLTGKNRTLAKTLALNMFSGSFPEKSAGNLTDWAKTVMGTELEIPSTHMFEPAFTTAGALFPIFNLQRRCPRQPSPFSALLRVSSTIPIKKDVHCVKALYLWRNSATEINDQLFKGYMKGNPEKKANEILSAYDFSNSNENTFNVTLWYNSTLTRQNVEPLVRVPRAVNMATNAYLQFLKGPKTKIMFDFVKEMPKARTVNKLDFAALIGTVFFTWVVLQLFPVVLTALVYEKQERLRIMMKMHGLGDGPYWLISYAYFLTLSALYMLCFIGFGSVLGLSNFTQNDYSIQFVFYFTYINLQIVLAFLLASVFSDTRTATVVAYMFVFGSGLLGGFFFESLISDSPRSLLIFLELYPGFSLYRGLFELGQYATEAKSLDIEGMTWGKLSDSHNGMTEVLIIMSFEWFVLLLLAFYLDKVVTGGKSPLFFLKPSNKMSPSTLRVPSLDRKGSKSFGDNDKHADVNQEREKVKEVLQDPMNKNHVVVCDKLKKVYPGRDGNPEKFAVRGLSLALPRGECFGMLGPSGAGKTSFIEMMIGLTKPTFGTAYVAGLDIVTQMNEIYTCMGVCPQYDLLWENLTGKEHLLFYGRLKNLKGSVLTTAVEESLKNLNLFHGGVADKPAGQYSGGMKRRLSVAISLIGNPVAVYLDEPSTGLDPASRNTLWNVIKLAKQNRVIILTTHSMEEAEFLCDRLGIFVDGRMQCIGNPKELKGRYGGSYVFQMTTNSEHEEEVEKMVMKLSPSANRVYLLAGTQKFELPKNDVRIADVFQTVEHAKTKFTVYAWGLADTTLEDVFIKVASAPRKIESSVLDTD